MKSGLLDEVTLNALQGLNSEGSNSFLQEIIGIYVTNGGQIIGELTEAVQTNDPKTHVKIAHLAHKLKGMSLNLGASGVHTLAERMEELSKDKNRTEVQALLPSLTETYRLTCEELQLQWVCIESKGSAS